MSEATVGSLLLLGALAIVVGAFLLHPGLGFLALGAALVGLALLGAAVP